MSESNTKRVLSGMRPTGKLHLGHFVGALENWVRLQQQYDCFFFVADWHALTTDYADTSRVKENSIEMVFDWLACGLDENKSTIFIQSHVPEHAELHLLLSLITPLGWLERVPTYKEQRENIKGKDLGTYGFLGYPVLQSADILMYLADFVPVGEDQVVHVEVTREIARRFNLFYPLKQPKQRVAAKSPVRREGQPITVSTRDVFPEPQPLLTEAKKLPGTDGRKMSKSYGNAILLAEEPEVIRQKLQTMVNDPARAKREDPGNPDICPVGDLHKLFSSPNVQSDVDCGCRTAKISCIGCKSWAASSIIEKLAPMQERRRKYSERPDLAVEILEQGSRRARQIAAETMNSVRSAMNMSKDFEFEVQEARPTTARSRVLPLQVVSDWWDLAPLERADRVRSAWMDNLPSEVVLKQNKPSLYVNQRGRRVGVHTAREREARNWTFKVPDRHYDVLVLLCWQMDRERVTEITLPQRIIQPIWKGFPVEGRQRLIRIQQNGGVYQLLREGEEPLALREFVNNIDPLMK